MFKTLPNPLRSLIEKDQFERPPFDSEASENCLSKRGSIAPLERPYDGEASENCPSEDGFIAPLERSNRRKRTLLFVVVAVVGMGIAAIWLVKFSSNWSERAPSWTHCGSTAMEARSNGCLYDKMQRAWIPPECSFSEPGLDPNPYVDRKWYVDDGMKQEVNEEQRTMLQTGDGDDLTVYAEFFHDEHCLYAWRKLAFAVKERKPILDSRTINFHHATHCSSSIFQKLLKVQTDSFNKTDYRTSAVLKFLGCVPLS